MCWVSNYIPKLKTAEEDIKVKKILLKAKDSSLHSPCKTDFKWELGKVYESELGEISRPLSYYRINNGFHSCQNICKSDIYWCSYINNEMHMLFGINEGEEIFDAIIPKGSEYYFNEDGEYVSNKLIIL